jgi:hypothetical protein
VCKKCGWYALAGTFMDIDRAWEGDDEPARAADGKLPRWALVLLLGAVAALVESIVVRLATADGSTLRSAWSGTQFVLGLAGFFACQVVGFVILMREDSSASLLDVLLKPFKVSAALFRGLPRRLWVVNCGTSGLAAALGAVLIIGSVPWHVLWSWHVDYRSTQQLKDAIGQVGTSMPDKAEEKIERKKTACVIIGYELSDTGNLRTVLVARVDGGKLRYVGGVTPSGDAAQLFELRENLLSVRRSEPIIPMTFNSNWVLPIYSCEVSYASEQENRNVTDIQWEGDVRKLKLD